MKEAARPYREVRLDEPGTVTCQHGGEYSKAAICGAITTEKLPRAKLKGGWWNVWLCPRGHRFAERYVGDDGKSAHLAMDVASGKPVFGERP